MGHTRGFPAPPRSPASQTTTFTIAVAAVNEAPSFTVGADQNVLEDAGAATIAGFIADGSPGPADEAGQALSYGVANDSAGLFDVEPAISAGGDLTYTPAADAAGSATVTVTLMDDGGTANSGDDTSDPQTFTIAVAAVNEAPSFTVGADQTVLEDAGAATVAGFIADGSPGPADEAGQALSYSVSNDSAGLFDVDPAISAGGDLTYTPATDAAGSATVTVTLMDDGGTANSGDDTSDPQTFTIAVTPVNDAPSFSAGPDQTVNENAGAQTLASWATAIASGPANESGQALTFTLTNDNNALFSAQPDVAEKTGTLTYAAGSMLSGQATVTVTLTDDGGVANGGANTTEAVFSIRVNAAPRVSDVATTLTNADPFQVGSALMLDATLSDADSSLGDLSWTLTLNGGPAASGTGQFTTFNYTVQDQDTQIELVLTVTDETGNTTVANLFSQPVTTCENFTALDAPLDNFVIDLSTNPGDPPLSIQEIQARGARASIFFDSGSAELNARSLENLMRVADELMAFPEFTWTIEGHTAECGTNEENLPLGQARANAIVDHLVSVLGLDPGTFRAISYGEERPFCTQSEVSCWQNNSRGWFVLTGRQ